MDMRLTTLDILKTIHQITGARISLHDLNFKEVAAFPENLHPFCRTVQKTDAGKNKCTCADTHAFNVVRESGKPYTYKCHCGLIEAVAPIFNYGVLSGYFMMGQFRYSMDDEKQTILNLSQKYFSEKYSALGIINTIPDIAPERINNYYNMLVIVSEYMTHTNRLTDNTRDLASSIAVYIQRFYSSKVSVTSMCEHFSCSRTTLMNSFRAKYNMTIGEYLTEYRLQKAKEMLEKSGKSIKSIALDCGFSDQNYFSKVFLKYHGVTPSYYRTTNKKV